MDKKRLIFFIIFSFFANNAQADIGDYIKQFFRGTATVLSDKGIKALEENELEKARDFFNQASIEQPEAGEIHNDLGIAYYKAGLYDEAAQSFKRAQSQLENKKKNSDYDDDNFIEKRDKKGFFPDIKTGETLYNQGNAQAMAEDYQGALNSYIQALLKNPQDENARYNLELMRLKLEEEKESQKCDDCQDGENCEEKEGKDQKQGKGQKQGDKQESQGDENKEGNREESQGNKEKEDESAGESDGEKEDESAGESDGGKEGDLSQKKEADSENGDDEKDDMTMEQAESILNSTVENEADLIKQIFENMQGKPVKVEKDW